MRCSLCAMYSAACSCCSYAGSGQGLQSASARLHLRYYCSGAAPREHCLFKSICMLPDQAIGINYNPCVISTSARGFDVTAAGVNFQPNVIEVWDTRSCSAYGASRCYGATHGFYQHARACILEAFKG